ncbi:hypothetical protein HY485_05220 [Candidatus Woesearchaeota archaeon]|nr:hypothetical protein [Candidatus Woesearchaeota archaeon]
MPTHALIEKKELKDEINDVDSLEAAIKTDDSADKETLAAKTSDDATKIVGVDDVVYVHGEDSHSYTLYNGSEEFYDAKSNGVNYYELSMKNDGEKSELPVVEVHEDKVEKKAEQVQFEAWRSNGGINFLASDWLTKYEHTGAVAASSVADEERRIFSLMYPGWSKCLYELSKVLVSIPN